MHNSYNTEGKDTITLLHTLIPKDIPVIVGVSGGPDSMYLLHQLKTFWNQQSYTKKNLIIISCNHTTRDTIEEEISLVRSVSTGHTFITEKYTGINKSEKALRERRHNTFIHYCKKNKSTLLFLGHHLNDRIETSIMNITRGCGIQGIQSLKVRETHFLDSSVTIIRPLITLSKKNILTQCDKLSLAYCTDPTNEDITISQRNLIRKLLAKIGNTDRIMKSMQQLYNFLDLHNNHTEGAINNQDYSLHYLPLHNGSELVNICAGEWTDKLLYQVYKDHRQAINPRSTTLITLSDQLCKSGKQIMYQGLQITAYKYGSIIKVKK